MITPQERFALACFAKNIWKHGVQQDALIIDGGCYIGASTVALAEGLKRSDLPESERHGRIWSYDLFRTTPAMSEHYLKGSGLKAGDSFRAIFERNVSNYADYISVQAGDIQLAPAPSKAIAVLFLDILWSWDCTVFVGRNFYPRLEADHSLLVHQDFVYPFYPWVILSVGQLTDFFAFAYNVEYSSVVFDVTKRIRERDIDDPRNIPLPAALRIYDTLIDRLEGWHQGAVALGKALYLASLNRIAEARQLIDEIAVKFRNEALVMQYVDSIRLYCDSAVSQGKPVPLDQGVGI
ncbi:MAG: hypothetical protein JO097_14295 [Acidobacteriaceae bacterium]|nr:hypothetical protein [Acidobacteriaceae bacterium]MBV9294328.1 hypothetical protein [Acidobacteriaceae bacterium]MBV9764939.1 hypothetical protein [Acidobacteriaceae bacterium]